MTREKPKIYETQINGRKTRVTVPDNPNPKEILIDAIRDNFSPKAVATIASCLQTVRTNDQEVDREVWWLIELLGEMLGEDEMNRLIDELGL